MLPNNIVFQEYSDIFYFHHMKNAFFKKLALSHGKFTLKDRILPQNVCCYE